MKKKKKKHDIEMTYDVTFLVVNGYEDVMGGGHFEAEEVEHRSLPPMMVEFNIRRPYMFEELSSVRIA